MSDNIRYVLLVHYVDTVAVAVAVAVGKGIHPIYAPYLRTQVGIRR